MFPLPLRDMDFRVTPFLQIGHVLDLHLILKEVQIHLNGQQHLMVNRSMINGYNRA